MVRVISFLRSELTQFWALWTAYNPERHYMRGPGPKWREKYPGEAMPPMRIDGMDRVVSSR